MDLGKLSASSKSTTAESPDGIAKIYTNGTIITMAGGEFSTVEALAIINDKIMAAGTLSEAIKVAGPQSTTIDLASRCIVPGFIEPHVHLILTALTRHFYLDLSPLSTTTRDSALDKIKERADQTTGSDWVAGFGYDPSRVEGHEELDRDCLDKASREIPVFIVNQSGHIGYLNSKALEVAGIDDSITDPTFVKKDGRLTGVILETAVNKMGSFLTPPSVEDLSQWCAETLDTWAAKGCTTIFDLGIGSTGPNDVALLKAFTTG